MEVRMSEWQGVLVEPGRLILTQITQFLMSLLLMILILAIGMILSWVIKSVVIKVLRAVKLDELSDRIELDAILAKGGIQFSLSELIGEFCWWVGLLVTAVVAVNAVGLTVAADLLNRVVLFVPNVLAAIFIIIAGMFIASLLRNVVRAAASNAGLAQSNMLGRIVEVLIFVFAAAIALQQLNIATRIIDITIAVGLGSVGLAFALAVGLGCKDIAGKLIGEFVDSFKKK